MRLSGAARVDARAGPPGDPGPAASAERPFAIACRPLEFPHPAQGPICITSSPAPIRSAAGFPEECVWPTPGRGACPSECPPETMVSRRADCGQSGPSWSRGPPAQYSEQGGLPLRRAHWSRRPGPRGVQVARERCESAGCDQAERGLRRRMARPRIRRAERRSPEGVRCGVNDALVFGTVDGAIPAASSRCPESACCFRSDCGATEDGPPRWMAGRVRLGARPPSCGTWLLDPGGEAPDVRHNGT